MMLSTHAACGAGGTRLTATGCGGRLKRPQLKGHFYVVKMKVDAPGLHSLSRYQTGHLSLLSMHAAVVVDARCLRL